MHKDGWQIQITTDEAVMLMALARAYRNSAVDVITASNCAQAMTQIQVFRFDLMLLDLDMKDGSAMQLLHSVSQLRAATPVLLLTTGDSQSLALHEQIARARPYGCWHLLEKPFDLKKLNGYIERGLLERSFDDARSPVCHPVERNDKRHCQRFTRLERIQICLNDDTAGTAGTSFPATLTDISVGGMGISTNIELPARQKITFKEKFMHQTGVVVWSRTDQQTFRAGIRFT